MPRNRYRAYILVRTVKNGRVRANGHTYEVNKDVPGWERFEGKRLAFGVYPPEYPFLNLWGTEDEFKNGLPLGGGSSMDIRVDVNGTLPWEWWKKVPKIHKIDADCPQ